MADNYKVLQIIPVTDTTHAVFHKEESNRTAKFKVKAWALTQVTPDNDPESRYRSVIGMIYVKRYAFSTLQLVDEVEDGKDYGYFTGYEDED